jgi:hypothetical protein
MNRDGTMKRITINTRFLAILFLLIAGVQLYACTIPVFRYALDKWRPDPYGLSVSEKWLETVAGKEFLDGLADLPVQLQVVPTDKADGKMGLMLPAPGSPEMWEGPASVEAVRKLVDSPGRREIAKGILAGNSAVWVLVLTGDSKADAAIEAALTKRLKYLEQVAAIPPQDPFDPESQLGPGPTLRVGFAIVKVKRSDPAEELLVKMLAGPDGEELVKGNEPFAAPIFGRGRALGAWSAADLDDEGIDELTLFLLGACSCQVKAQNPGWDVLMATDWDAGLMKAAMLAEEEEKMALADAKPETPGIADPVAKPAEFEEPVTVKFSPSEPGVETVTKAEYDGPPKPVVMGIGLLVLVMGFFAWRSGM